jgi:recombinational DNA repair ATPase RecF
VLRIYNLRVKSFRGIRDANVTFGNHTVLLGQNGSGKTSIIEGGRVASVCIPVVSLHDQGMKATQLSSVGFPVIRQ